MKKTLFDEIEGKKEICHLTELKDSHNTRVCFSPPSIKKPNVFFYNHPDFVALTWQANFTNQRQKRKQAFR